MKLHNRIMSWILAPGAYALWHSLGNSEEWELDGEVDIIHKQHHWIRLEISTTGAIPWGFRHGLFFFFHGFFFDVEEQAGRYLGYFDRHLVLGRAVRTYKKLRRTYKKLRREKRASGYRKANARLFQTLTLGEP